MDRYGGLDSEIFDGIRDVQYLSDQSNFNILHFNIRSIRKNFEELIIYLHRIELNNIDVIVLSETFKVDNLDDFKIGDSKGFYLQIIKMIDASCIFGIR